MTRPQPWLLTLIAITLTLQGCATPYKPYGLMGGFDQRQLEPGVWRVSFSGNPDTTRETAQTYWLYRASELTLEQGYDGFEILSNMQFVGVSTPLRQVAAAGHVIFIPTYYGSSGGNPGGMSGDIRLLKSPVTPQPPKVFNALQLKAALDGPVNGPKCNEQNVCPHVHHYLLVEGPANGTAAPTSATPPAGTPLVTRGAARRSAPPVSVPPALARPPAPATATPVVVLPPAEFRCPDPGTIMQTSTGSVLTFKAPGDFRCVYVDEAGTPRERYAMFVDGFGHLARPDLNSLWPLSAGKRVDFFVAEPVRQTSDRTVSGHSAQESFSVVGQARIAVPAGTFDTFVVAWTETGTDLTTTHKVKVTFWYAPAVGYVVKTKVDVEDAGATDPYALALFKGLAYEASAILPPGSIPPIPGTAIASPAPPPAAPPAPPAAPAPPGSTPASAPGDSAVSPGTASVEVRLQTLRQLLDQHLITREEYAARRKAIIDHL